MRTRAKKQIFNWRFYFVVLVLLLCTVGLVWRMVHLTVINRDFLKHQGDVRSLRIIKTPAYRGMITDRQGEPLAISTPVDSVWVNPQDFSASSEALKRLSSLLKISNYYLKKRLRDSKQREFVYIKRGILPDVASKIKQMDLPGLYLQHEFRRFYPAGEMTAHLLGFTNVDDKGQEGIELAYNEWLSGKTGKQQVLRDRMGHIVANVKKISEPRPGRNLVLSIDKRIQFLAYRELKDVVEKNKAQSGSIVVLDAKTGEVLAMVNQPSFNPNMRRIVHDGRYRNRAVTDTFEPGSVVKAFSITAALMSNQYKVDSLVDTSPGWMVVNGNRIHDHHNNGVLSVTEILQRSSNVGVTKMMLSLPEQTLWSLLHEVGFGQRTQSGFPGESSGVLPYRRHWNPFVLATLGFGYGLSVTPLQLAQAFTIFANQGKLLPVSLVVRDKAPAGRSIVPTSIAEQMLATLESVVERGGTGVLANMESYRAAGKTGTARLVGKEGYEENHHVATFVGIAPVTRPRLIVAVVITDPQAGKYYGGVVSAPAFEHVMQGALRILNVAPDKLT